MKQLFHKDELSAPTDDTRDALDLEITEEEVMEAMSKLASGSPQAYTNSLWSCMNVSS